jgi:ATP-dependent DNA helicase RecG
MKASDSITYVKGIGDVLAEKFRKLRIKTVQDLVDYVPRKYDDYSQIIRVSQIRPGPVSLKVKIGAVKIRYSRKGLHMTEALASDESGSVKLVWFNQPYRAQSIKTDEEYFVSGEFASSYKYFAITNPACELVSSFPVNTARLVPQYRLTKGLGPAQFRKVMKNVLTEFRPSETLPSWLLDRVDLMPKADALKEMHFPTDLRSLFKAKKRIAFEEVFELALAGELNRQEHKLQHSLQIPFKQKIVKDFVHSLPFKLTNDQRKVSWEIFTDMQSGSPMNRLVEGDVGSGKTVVAVLAMLGVISSDFQVVFMAPTELLANQHAKTIHKMLAQTKFADNIVLLTGSMSPTQKEAAYSSILSGEAKIVIGTHIVFHEKVVFKNLGLVIVDEQHRFGVAQRKALQAKSNKLPHVLNMTATPIPRSLALTLYGEMDVSIIPELPPGRKPVRTSVEIPENRPKIYSELADELDKGFQAFVVCPQIEETDFVGRLSVVALHKELNSKYLEAYKVGLLHGKMKSVEKEQVMQDFINKKFDVLVATTVIEVGVDVPNATTMVVEGADRFGLAQLHQLRGRVGRGSEGSLCVLIASENDNVPRRLKLLEHENNGFKLAEYDLEQRGPGAIYGTMQHGELDLRVAELTDVDLIKQARNSAREFIARGENMLKYPEVKARVDRLRIITNLN